MSQEEVIANGSGFHINRGERRLEGKVALITGAVGGIGEVIARLFVHHGAKLILADISDEGGRKLSETLGQPGVATYVHCDVSNDQHMQAAVDLAVTMHGHLDIMYSNAGIIDRSCGNKAADYDMEEFDRIMSVNVRGTMAAIKHAARVMIPRKKGCIVCTASIAGITGALASYAYTASKHAVLGLVKNAAGELGKHGIRVNSVSPYGVATAMSVGTMKSLQNKLNMESFCDSMANLKGQTLKAEDVAEAGLFLASDEAKYVSGHNLVIDGGFTVVNHSWLMYR
ncbi:momilactone A synthase [Cryptomeria japonica]|uniref:momilactone A synthase n=1 Tax=Cryptomeria japonica TaxID=3369 RepID=UPI0025AB847F|nr:momilactone A synthase [Cryptomeria japonica]